MKVKAAVAHQAGAPLVIETVDLDGPKAGEVLVEIKATGVCHTDEFTRSGADRHYPSKLVNFLSASTTCALNAGLRVRRPRRPDAFFFIRNSLSSDRCRSDSIHL